MTPLEREVYDILNFFPQWLWAWTLIIALWEISSQGTRKGPKL